MSTAIEEHERMMEEGHSSALTNQRVFNILDTLWRVGLDALSQIKPSPSHTLTYYSTIIMYYVEVHSFFTYRSNRVINKKFCEILAKANPIRNEMVLKGMATPDTVEQLNTYSTQLHLLINSALQTVMYFYRGAKTRKGGIEKALEIFGADDEGWKTISEDDSSDSDNLNEEDGDGNDNNDDEDNDDDYEIEEDEDDKPG